MKIYYSGVSGAGVFPELLIVGRKPPVMLSFYDINDNNGTAVKRFHKHKMNLAKPKKKK